MSDGDFLKNQINQARVTSGCGRSFFAGDSHLGQTFLYGKIQFNCCDSTRDGCVTKANTSPGPSSVSKGCKLHT